MKYYLTLKRKIYMIEEVWMLLKEINKVVEVVDLKTYFLCLVVEEDNKKEDPPKPKQN